MTPAKRQRSLLPDAQRIVVKIGSSSLTTADGHLNHAALDRLVDVLAERVDAGSHVVLVSSGSVAAGIGPLKLDGRPRDLATIQAAASVGQGLLVARYTERFDTHGITAAQVLLTSADTIRRSHYNNARRALERLLDLGVVPVVNENDTVATDELRFGDNDRLAAIVSHIVKADALVLLTDVDGLYDAPPSREGAQRIREVASVHDLEGIEVTGRGSALGTGGMVTKLQSVAIATASGIPVVLTSAENAAAALRGDEVGTFFAAAEKRTKSRTLWLAHAAQAHGKVVVDAGAARAVLGGKASLLAAGVTGVIGTFEAGDPVEIVDPDGKVIARGLSSYGAGEVPDLIADLRQGTGTERARKIRPVIHRDDLVVTARKPRTVRS